MTSPPSDRWTRGAALPSGGGRRSRIHGVLAASAALSLAALLAAPAAAAGTDGGAGAGPASPASSRASRDGSAAGDPPSPPGMEETVSDFFEPSTAGEILLPVRNQVIPPGRSSRFGNWDGRFFLSETATYDDNILLASRGKKKDLVLLSTLGGAFNREGSDIAAEFAAAGTWEAYTRHPDQNLVDGHLRAGLQYGLRRGWFRVTDLFTRRQDALQSTTTPGGGVVLATGADNVLENTNEGALAGGYSWARTSLEAQYRNSWTRYAGGFDDLDGMTQSGLVTARYQTTPKSEASLQLEYRDVTYEEAINNDYSLWGVYLGGRWMPSPKTEIFGRVGCQWMHATTSGTVADDSEYTGPSGLLGARWVATPKLKLEAFLSGDVYTVAGANYQRAILLGATASWDVSPLWTVRCSGQYQASDPSAGGPIDYFTGQARVGYLWKPWWEIALQYDFRTRESGEDLSDYVNHRVSLQFTFLF